MNRRALQVFVGTLVLVPILLGVSGWPRSAEIVDGSVHDEYLLELLWAGWFGVMTVTRVPGRATAV